MLLSFQGVRYYNYDNIDFKAFKWEGLSIVIKEVNFKKYLQFHYWLFYNLKFFSVFCKTIV
jgi:hypothetical protein